MDDTLHRYVEEVAALQTRRADALSAADLADIGRQLGLSDADLAAIDEEATARLVRAQNFAANEMWDDAIKELESVSALAPHRADALELRARVFAGRWRADGRDGDRVQALALARQVIQHDPGQLESYRLIKDLQTPRSRWPYVAGGLTAGAFAGVIAWAATSSAIAVLAVVLVVVLLVAVGSRVIRPLDEETPLLGPASVGGLLTGATRNAVSDHPMADLSMLDVPLVLAAPEAWEGLSIRVRVRSVETYADSTYVRLAFEVRPARDEQIDGLKVRVNIEDAGELLFTEVRDLLTSSGQAPAQRDRPAVVEVLASHQAAVHPSQIRLELLSISRGAAPKLCAPLPIEPDWQAPRPERFELEFRYLGTTDHAAEGWCQLWWEVENVGKRPVTRLFCRPKMVGEGGEELSSWSDMLTYQNLVLFPGETRLHWALAELPAKPWAFALTVTEAD